MKPLIVYHNDCTDGFGAAFAAWMKFGDEAEYVPMSYGSTPDIETWHIKYAISQREIYVLDFSFERDTTDYIVARAKRLVWLDHHKTAFEMWTGEYKKGDLVDSGEFGDGSGSKILLDDNRSGALIAWEYFHPGTEVPMMIKHIDDRDRWQFKIEGSKELHAALASYRPWSFEQWKELNHQMQNWDDSVSPHFVFKEGSAILRAHKQNVMSVVATGRRDVAIKITVPQHGPEISQLPSAADGYDRWFAGLTCNCPPYLASDVGHELANQSGTFGLCWYQGRDGKAKVSLRSNGEYDVSAIAKSFGGGGHRNAAGFEIDMSTLMGWLK